VSVPTSRILLVGYSSSRIEELLKDLWLDDKKEWPFGKGEWPDSDEEWNKLMLQQLSLRWKQTVRYRDRVNTWLKKLDKASTLLSSCTVFFCNPLKTFMIILEDLFSFSCNLVPK